MKTYFIMACFFALPGMVLAFGTETVGNAPVTAQSEWAVGVIQVVNLKTRVYSYWVNGNEHFFYRGKVDGLNEALDKYAGIKQEVLEVFVLPGVGKSQNFKGEAVLFDWQFHVPSGIYRAMSKKTDVTLTIYINQPRAKPPSDRKQIDAWIEELDHEDFTTREKASKELEKLGNNLKPIYREALKSGQQKAEGQKRIESLLAKLKGIDLDDLVIPKGIKLIDAEDLVTTHLKGIEDSNNLKRSLEVQDLGRLAEYSDKVVPAMAEVLKKDKDAHVRRCAAGSLSQMGSKSQPALEVLKECLKDPDAYLQDACQRAIDGINKDKEKAVDEAEQKLLQTLLKDINDFKKEKKSK